METLAVYLALRRSLAADLDVSASSVSDQE